MAFLLNQGLEQGHYFLICMYSFDQMKVNLITDHFQKYWGFVWQFRVLALKLQNKKCFQNFFANTVRSVSKFLMTK